MNIFITGAGKGIGLAVVQAILAASTRFQGGPKLFLTSRTESDLKTLQTEAHAVGVRTEYYACDLAMHPVSAFEIAVKTYGRIDAVIHCAGVGRFGDFLNLSSDDFDYTVKTNEQASFLLMQSVYRHMKSQVLKTNEKMRGQIQFVTSVAAEKPFLQSAIYCMSKAAQRALIEVMRLSASQDQIRILEVQPGATYTPMWGQIPAEMISKMMNANDVALPMVEALLLPDTASLEIIKIRPLQGDL